MNDLELWQRLTRTDADEHTEDDERIVVGLRALAELPIRARAPFMGFIDDVLGRASAPIRAAAVATLAGVQGHGGWQRIVAALDDEHESVRAEAVRSLRKSCNAAPDRWAHAMFHPREDVRRAALQTDAPPQSTHLAAYLRADPELAELAKAHPWPARPCALIFDLLLRGNLTEADAARALIDAPADDLRQLLRHSVRRGPESVADALADVERGRPAVASGHDLFDLWCQLYWSQPDHRPGLLDALTTAALGPTAGLHPRLALAVLAYGERRGHLRAPLQLATACRPSLLDSAHLPVELRRSAALGLHRYRARVRNVPTDLIDTLLAGDLLDDRLLDLRLACVLVSFLPTQGIARLVTRFGEQAVLDATLRQPRSWSMIAELPDEPGGGPQWFLERVRPRDPDVFGRLVARGLRAWAGRAASTKAKREGKRGQPLETPPLLDRVVAGLDALSTAQVVVALVDPEHPPSLQQLTKLVDLLQPKLDTAGVGYVFARLLPSVELEASQLVLQRLAHHNAPAVLAPQLAELDLAPLLLLCLNIERLNIRSETERALALALRDHHDTAISTWARTTLADFEVATRAVETTSAEPHTLTRSEAERIATCTAAELGKALAPALRAPAHGLCAALQRRTDACEPNIAVCTALLGCRDPLDQVAAGLQHFGAEDSAFVQRLEQRVIATWLHNASISAFGHAWLHRWEQHGFALLAWIDQYLGSLWGVLRFAAGIDDPLTRRALWAGLTSAILLRRYRHAMRLRPWCTSAVMTEFVDALDTDLGPYAARLLATFGGLGFAREPLAALHERVIMLVPDMDVETRRELERWVRVDGLEARTTPARPHVAKLRRDRVQLIRACRELDRLVEFCRSGHPAVVHEAVLRMVELGRAGQRRLAAVLVDAPPTSTMLAVTSSIASWSDETALERVRTLASEPLDDSERRFRIAMALLERNETGCLTLAVEAAAQQSRSTWLTANDWQALLDGGASPRTLAVALAGSVHPHAYQRAVRWLLDHGGDDARSLDALGEFLEAGTRRPLQSRREVALRLLDHGDPRGLVVAVAQLTDPSDIDFRGLFDRITALYPALTLAEHVVSAALVAGAEACSESRCLALLESESLRSDERDRGLSQLLVQGRDASVREELVKKLSTVSRRDALLGQVSELFAWGVRKGRELTGRLFRVHMTERRQDLGYTRMTENTIYVSALPLLRGDRHGRDVVEALILHEYGHHLYHGDKRSQKLWRRAQTEGLGSLLNLVADEHLERRLRALNAEYGDRLKRLAAYAFQHTNRELPVSQLLNMLQASTFGALSVRPLSVAFDATAVEIDSGLVLRELDRRGHPFARFVRAMRMGMGNRHDDPLLHQALALFKGGFRHQDMRGLYDIAVQLSALYGNQSELASSFGGHESLEWGERGSSVHSEGLSDDDVQQEVERILRPNTSTSSAGEQGPPGKLQINVGRDTRFREIRRVERVAPDRSLHRSVATEVRRHSLRLRQYFEQLGLALVPRRARLRGRAFDRTRVRAVVLRRDPRMLVARELEVHTDLFIGVVIDCSGSMVTGRSMDKAQRFGVLLAEAARGLAGVDARFFGFTDQKIYDAGDESSCAVTSLQPTGGNNDAAALHYAATIAAGSARRAKLLVMISDGLPTECSVSALRNVVAQLSKRKGILCAQVAVRPLAEVSFPHYVELTHDELDRSVRRFGEILTGLAKRALGR